MIDHYLTKIKEVLPSSFATITLAVILLLTYTFSFLISPYSLFITSSSVLIQFGLSDAVLTGEFYRLITSIFIHANIVHLASNLLFLVIFGLRLEELRGNSEIFLIFILSGLIGNIGSLLWFFLEIDILSFGSSGSIFGFFGALIYLLRGKSKGEQRKMFFLCIFFLSFTLGQNTNIISHILGVIGGYSLMWIFKTKLNW